MSNKPSNEIPANIELGTTYFIGGCLIGFFADSHELNNTPLSLEEAINSLKITLGAGLIGGVVLGISQYFMGKPITKTKKNSYYKSNDDNKLGFVKGALAYSSGIGVGYLVKQLMLYKH